jgi:hypothetical protein
MTPTSVLAVAAGGDHGSGGLNHRLFLDMNDFARHPPWRHTRSASTPPTGALPAAGWDQALAFVVLGVGVAVAIRAARRRTDRLGAPAGRIAATHPVAWAGRRFPRHLAWPHRHLDPALRANSDQHVRRHRVLRLGVRRPYAGRPCP